jgi:hypothetical protein
MTTPPKPTAKLTPAQKRKLIRRVYALRGKFKHKGLMKAFLREQEKEKSD